ncbi:MAG TPA: helix-turn-helix domain-containing protein [Candidatus Omnitrophota bacterium]|nr:helix-turn-helix domain-containing protein [Candidatus Omnitrophota bacterium]HPN56147.1 helix-turn-helix domain-containing protein [Candidatus Omnitrophota bacterium]
MKILGKNIKKFREEIGMSRKYLAQRLTSRGCKCTGRTVYNWERESTTPDANTLAEMHLIFGKPLRLFFKPVAYKIIFIFSLILSSSFCAYASEAGKKMTKEFEGFRAKIYSCPSGHKTVGYGFNLDDSFIRSLLDGEIVFGKRSISRQEADVVFDVIYSNAEKDAIDFVGADTWGKIGVARQDIIIDMAYNLGRQRLFKFIKLREAIKSLDYPAAAEQMRDSLWYKQTGRRARNHVDNLK